MTCAGNGGSDNNKEFKYLKRRIKFNFFCFGPVYAFNSFVFKVKAILQATI
jgi:hypothetical protein